MSPVLCEGDVTAVCTLGGVRTGKGSGWIVTRKKTNTYEHVHIKLVQAKTAFFLPQNATRMASRVCES